VREYLETHLPLKWICDFVATMDTLVVQRALELAQKQLLAELPEAHRPSVKWCWLFFGQCARKEALLRAAQESGILYEDPAPDQQESTRGWFLRLGARVAHILEVCGFARGPLSADRSENVRALSQWVSRFERCTHEFCEDEQLESCLPYFDMRAVAGSTQLPDQLHERWKNSFTSGDFFLQRLARAALENLPPLTIFKNAIVDTDGEVDTRLDIVRNILQPLADCARVLAYAQGFARIVPSMERLSAVAEQLPEKKDLLLEAAEAFRVALYHRAICATRHGDDGRFLIPSELNKIDQELFKSVFRTIDELFKYMRARFGVPEEDGD